jgi:hypothetical protein
MLRIPQGLCEGVRQKDERLVRAQPFHYYRSRQEQRTGSMAFASTQRSPGDLSKGRSIIASQTMRDNSKLRMKEDAV